MGWNICAEAIYKVNERLWGTESVGNQQAFLFRLIEAVSTFHNEPGVGIHDKSTTDQRHFGENQSC